MISSAWFTGSARTRLKQRRKDRPLAQQREGHALEAKESRKCNDENRRNDIDDVPERFRDIGGTYRDMFQRLLAPHMPDAEFKWFDVVNGELPPSADA